MIDAVTSLFKQPPQKQITRPEAGIRLKTRPRFDTGQSSGYTKVFHWPVPAGQTSQPKTVEIVGSFSGWRRIPLSYDRPSRSWLLMQKDIQGNCTHRYVILVDGKPSCDDICDGLVAPQSPEEARWQIETARGPRIMLKFAQTK